MDIIVCTRTRMLSATSKKAGRPNNLSKYEESLIFISADIECGRGLIMYSNCISERLQHVVKAVKLRHGDNGTN